MKQFQGALIKRQHIGCNPNKKIQKNMKKIMNIHTSLPHPYIKFHGQIRPTLAVTEKSVPITESPALLKYVPTTRGATCLLAHYLFTEDLSWSKSMQKQLDLLIMYGIGDFDRREPHHAAFSMPHASQSELLTTLPCRTAGSLGGARAPVPPTTLEERGQGAAARGR